MEMLENVQSFEMISLTAFYACIDVGFPSWFQSINLKGTS